MSKLPSIPPNKGKNTTIDRLKELAEIWKGERGNKLDKVVTFRDLVSSGLGAVSKGGRLTQGDSIGIKPTYTLTPENLSAIGGLNAVFLNWDGETAPNYGYTELYRHTSDNLADAVLVATSIASLYVDNAVTSGQEYFYWVRSVSITGQKTSFNATTGTAATVALEPAYIIERLNGLISESELAAELLNPISTIPSIQSTLDDHHVRLPTVESYVDQLNIDVSVLNIDVPQLQTTVSDLESDVADHAAHLANLDNSIAASRTIPAFDSSKDYAVDDLVRYGGVAWRVLVAQTAPVSAPVEGVNWTNIGSYVTYDGVLSADAQAISDNTSRITTAENSISSHASDITDLQTSLGNANTNITANATAVSALDSRVTDNEGLVSAQATDISSLQSSLTNTNTNVTANADAVTALDTRVTSTEDSITAQASDITSLETSLTNTNTNVTANSTAITSLDSRVTTTETTISSQASSITALEASLNDIIVSEFDANEVYAVDDIFKYNNEFYKVIATQTPPNATPPNATYYEASPDYTSLQSEVTANSSAIGGLETRVDAAEGTISAHSTDITVLQTDLDAAELNIAANTSATSGLETRVDAAEGSITANSSLITNLQADVDAAELNITANTNAHNSLDARVVIAEEAITASATDITTLQSELDAAELNIAANVSAHNALKTRVTATENGISSQADDITALQISVTANDDDITATNTAVSNLTTRVTTAENNITSSANDITTLNADLDAAELAIAQNGLDIDANAQAVSDLSVTVTNQGNQITSQGESITLLESDIDNLQNADLSTSTAIANLTTRVTATEGSISSQATDITSINSSIDAINGSIIGINGDISANTGAISSLDTRVEAAEGSVVTHTSQITQLQNDLSLLDVEGNASAIDALDLRVAATENDIEAQALSIQGLNISVGNNYAALQDKAEASIVTSLDGEVQQIKAQRTIKLDVNGRVSGIGLMNDGATSELIVASDSVYFIDPDQSVTPFIPGHNYPSMDALRSTQIVFGYAKIEGQNRFVINAPAYIQNGSITTAQIANAMITQGQIEELTITSAEIGDGAITSAKIANVIESINYQPGQDGWQIKRSGEAEFNEITIYDGDGDVAFRSGDNYLITTDKKNWAQVLDNNYLDQRDSEFRPSEYAIQVNVNGSGLAYLETDQDYIDLGCGYDNGLFVMGADGSPQAYYNLISKAIEVKPGDKCNFRIAIKTNDNTTSRTYYLRLRTYNGASPGGTFYIGGADVETTVNIVSATGSVTLGNVNGTSLTPGQTHIFELQDYTIPENVSFISLYLTKDAYTTGKEIELIVEEMSIFKQAAQVVSTQIADASINNAKIKDAAVDRAKIKDAAIDTLKVAENAVTTLFSASFTGLTIYSYGTHSIGSMTINHGHSEVVDMYIEASCWLNVSLFNASEQVIINAQGSVSVSGATFNSSTMNFIPSNVSNTYSAQYKYMSNDLRFGYVVSVAPGDQLLSFALNIAGIYQGPISIESISVTAIGAKR